MLSLVIAVAVAVVVVISLAACLLIGWLVIAAVVYDSKLFAVDYRNVFVVNNSDLFAVNVSNLVVAAAVSAVVCLFLLLVF